MTSYRQGQDVWLYPIEIPAGVQLAWAETSDTLSIELAPGTYWCFTGSSVGGRLSLLNTLADDMTAESALNGDGVTYTLEARTPTRSVEHLSGGIGIIADSADFLSINLTASSATLCQVLGFLGADTGTIAATPGAVAGTYEVVGRYSRYGAWLSPVCATSRLRTPRRLIEWSSDYTDRDDAYAVDYGDKPIRTHRYEWIPAAHVWASRGADAQYAAAAGLAAGDVHNAFETVWSALAQLDEVIVIHHLEGDAIDLAITTHAYEVVRAGDKAQAQDFGRVARLQRAAGEWYELEMTTRARVEGDGY